MSTIDWSQFEEDPDIVMVEGSQRAGSQYHFYMETQSAIAYPTEEGGVKLYASTQSPDDIQGRVAQVCSLPANKVTIEVSKLLLFFLRQANNMWVFVPQTEHWNTVTITIGREVQQS